MIEKTDKLRQLGTVRFTDSISAQLLKVIFGLYLLVAIFVTVIQMYVEYAHVKEDVHQELKIFHKTSGPGITKSLWAINKPLLLSIMAGMHENPTVTGVQVREEQGQTYVAIGTVQDDDGQLIFYNKKGKKLDIAPPDTLFSEPFEYSFPIVYVGVEGVPFNIGIATVYSNNQVVMDRVEYGFILIVINSIIKTLALWFIFIFFLRKLLGRPLQELTNGIGKVNFDNLEYSQVDINTPERNEIAALADAFNGMIDKLSHTAKQAKQTEIELRESKERFKDFSEASSDWFYEMDENLRFSYFSEQFTGIIGIAEKDLIGKTRQESGLDMEDESVRRNIEDLEAHRPFRNFEHSRKRPDGSIVHMSTSAIPIFNKDGSFRGYRGSGTDITEHKQAEKAFRETEKSHRMLFETMAQGVVYQDATGSILSANPTAETLLGLSLDQMRGRTSTDPRWKTVHEDGSAFPGETHPGMIALKTGEKVTGVVMGVFNPVDDNYRWIIVDAIPQYRGGEDKPYQVFTTFMDITERMALEEKLRRSEKMKAVGQLTGGLAHDFNNLLNIMMGNAELLEIMVGDDEKAQRKIETIIKSVDRGASLTKRLLAFSRKQTLSPQSSAINDLVTGLEDMLKRTLGETIELRTHFEAGTCEALVDPHQLEDAMVNLSINARDAMPDGGVLSIETANVTLDEAYAQSYEEVTPGDYVKVAVTDTGTGIAPEVLESVFEPFFTTKDVGEGSGLGLSMVFGFIKQSGGHITIYSEVGHGTTISLYLPRSGEAIDRKTANDHTPKPEPERGHERILVVEDDEDLREISTSILKDHGYEIVEAKDGKEAIELLKEGGPFDLVFTDVILPGGMNGVEIAEEAKRIQPNIKALFTSGYAENSIMHIGKLDPDVNMVGKPFRRTDLLEKVRAMLDRKGD